MYVHVSQVTDYDRVGRWQIPPSWPKREEEGPTRPLAGAPWGLNTAFGGGRGWQGRHERPKGLNWLARRNLGGGCDGGCWKGVELRDGAFV